MQMHIYLHTYESENLFWAEALDHYNETGTLSIIAKTLKVDPILFEYVGF